MVWYDINDKVAFEMVKQNFLQIPDVNALRGLMNACRIVLNFIRDFIHFSQNDFKLFLVITR